MNTNALPAMLIVFLSAAVGMPIVGALSEKLALSSEQRKGLARTIRSATALVGWFIVAIITLTGNGFEFLALMKRYSLY